MGAKPIAMAAETSKARQRGRKGQPTEVRIVARAHRRGQSVRGGLRAPETESILLRATKGREIKAPFEKEYFKISRQLTSLPIGLYPATTFPSSSLKVEMKFFRK